MGINVNIVEPIKTNTIMSTYFTKRRIVVKNAAGEIVERYGSLKEFHAAYPTTGTYNSVAKKVCNLVDGWMPDGKIVRYFKDRDKDGRPFQLSKVRDNEKMSEREQWRQDLLDTEAKIQEAYDLCDAGEITFEERHQRLGWLQNHAAVLRRRLGIRD